MPQGLRNNGFARWLRRRIWRRQPPAGPRRGQRTHVIILDGTMSSLRPDHETNAGLLYKLICEAGGNHSIYYEPGLQWSDWRTGWAVMTGKGINRQIRRAYGYLASRYRPGDRIFLFGYSRGAYAVRSLAGLIDRVGLVTAAHATERNISLAYRHYEGAPETLAARQFRARFCHDTVSIDMLGVWDTVKALGVRLPLLWRLSEPNHAFHNHELGSVVKRGFHALAYHETRQAYEPVLWDVPPSHANQVEQVWFPGNHGDVGGQVEGHCAARPLANISLVWMLGRAAGCGLDLPEGWRARFPTDPAAPSIGGWLGWSKVFVLRRKRHVLTSASETLHPALRLRGRPEGWMARIGAFLPHR